jgi:valyl-tRNA synthetase
LLQQAGKNQDIKFSEDRVRLAGTFCNKLWNATRFVLGQAGQDPALSLSEVEQRLTLPDRWILSRLNGAAQVVDTAFANCDMDDAARALYSFLWDDFCDWFVELAKPRLREGGPDAATAKAVLVHTLGTAIRLMHPLMPFITEELWQSLAAGPLGTGHSTIMTAPYPIADAVRITDAAEARMAIVSEAVRALRNLRSQHRIDPGAWLEAAVVPADREAAEALSDNVATIAALARLRHVSICTEPPSGEGTWLGTPVDRSEVYLASGGAVDQAKERSRLEREGASLLSDIDKCREKLGNAAFIERAPAHIVARERELLEALTDRLARVEEKLGLLER